MGYLTAKPCKFRRAVVLVDLPHQWQDQSNWRMSRPVIPKQGWTWSSHVKESRRLARQRDRHREREREPNGVDLTTPLDPRNTCGAVLTSSPKRTQSRGNETHGTAFSTVKWLELSGERKYSVTTSGGPKKSCLAVSMTICVWRSAALPSLKFK